MNDHFSVFFEKALGKTDIEFNSHAYAWKNIVHFLCIPIIILFHLVSIFVASKIFKLGKCTYRIFALQYNIVITVS